MTNHLFNIKRSLYITLGLVLMVSSVSFAQSYATTQGDSINPNVYVTTGYFFPNINTSLRVDSDLGLGTEINLEDDLKLDERLSVFSADALIKLSKRSQLFVAYTSMRRSKLSTLESDIEFGDTTFFVGAEANYKFNVDYFAATWRYSFFNEKNWNAGLSLGARAMNVSTNLAANLNSRSYAKSASILAPAILFGVHGSAYLTPKLLARYSLEYLYVDIGSIDVTILESKATLSYFIYKDFGLGLAYSTNDYRLRNLPIGNNFNGKVLFGFGGLNLFLTARL